MNDEPWWYCPACGFVVRKHWDQDPRVECPCQRCVGYRITQPGYLQQFPLHVRYAVEAAHAIGGLNAVAEIAWTLISKPTPVQLAMIQNGLAQPCAVNGAKPALEGTVAAVYGVTGPSGIAGMYFDATFPRPKHIGN